MHVRMHTLLLFPELWKHHCSFVVLLHMEVNVLVHDLFTLHQKLKVVIIKRKNHEEEAIGSTLLQFLRSQRAAPGPGEVANKLLVISPPSSSP